jgi:tetratricopeptide (TPR) repeat protein
MNFSQVKTSDEELRVMLESGLVLREAGRLDEAEKIFLGVRELVPKSDVPVISLSSLAVRRGDFDKALRLCEEALAIDPTSVFARVYHAEVLLYQRRREEAEAELRDIIEFAPESPHARTAQALLDAAQLMEPN